MSETLTSIQAYVIKTKRKLKTWETNFQLKHNRSPTLDDIKSRVTIEKEYQEYQRQKNLLVKKHRQIIQADLTHRLLQNKQSTVQQEGTGQDELPDWEEYRQAIHSFHQLYKSSNTIILNEQSENAGEDHTIETRIINFTCTEKEAQLIESLTMQSLSEKLPVILYEIVQWIFYFQKNHNRYPNCDDILSDRYIIKAFKKYEILMDTALKFLEKEYDGITIPSMFKHSKTTRKPLSSRSSCSSQVDLTTETKKETILKDRHPMTSIEGKEGLTEDFDSFDSKDLTIKRAGRSPTECSTYSLESGVSKTPPGRAKREREECTVTPDDRSNKVKRLFLERQESVCSTSADDFEELKDILKGQKKSRVADDRAFWLGIDVQLPPDQPNHDSVNGDDFPHSEKMVFDSHSPDKKSQLNGHSSPSNPEMSALKSNKDGANGQNSMDKKEEPIQTYNGERVAKELSHHDVRRN
ncbi:hypothetical protein BDB01DRAFT_184341 [Pilobolus umbonatus]|nr:hypothetical protein BDB01DRAFT_184341 [Pilobolus umbonatus]